MVEGARLESVFRGNSNVGSNPTLSAKPFIINNLRRLFWIHFEVSPRLLLTSLRRMNIR